MYKIPGILFFLFISPFYLAAGITPAEGSGLNYRIIGFSFPQAKGITEYRIEIASGNYNNDDDFRKNIIISLRSKENRIIAEVPHFGAQYTWRVIYTGSGAIGGFETKKNELHHFSTKLAPEVDIDSTRLRILSQTAKNEDSYVFVDATKTLYDMDGHPVWYIPYIDAGVISNAAPRDLKSSCWGTITFMMNEQAYEINYNGDILWTEPEAGLKNKRGYERIQSLNHHEFTRLANGHYMTLGMERVFWEVPGKVDTAKIHLKNQMIIDSSTGKTQQKLFSGKIIEYDEKHNIVWSWSAADYFKQSDLYYRRKANGLFQIGNTHENAFYFDEKAKTLYVSFRNIHRIIKLEYPSGKVLNTYGQLYIPGNFEIKNDLFCGQHDCRLSQDGYLYLYNNNTCNRLCGQLPTILIMQEPETPEGTLKKVWEYECTLDSMREEEQAKLRLETGGSVCELPDRSILCCMGGNYSKVFIVNRDKKILWSALPERWNTNEKKWKAMPGFKASIITRKELESLVWGEPLKK